MAKISKEKFVEISANIKQKNEGVCVLHISVDSNKKLASIPSVNLPALFTCKECGCSKECYCLSYPMATTKSLTSHWRNLNLFLKNSDYYFKSIQNYLDNPIQSFKYFRWHSSGDIVNETYLKGMIETAKKCKNVRFLAFTKKFELVNEWISKNGKLPKNLKIVFSHWGKDFEVVNPYNLPVTYIDFGDDRNEAIPENTLRCSGRCYECMGCWLLKEGESVVFDLH